MLLGLSQLVNGQNSESRSMCPPTSVDCSCVGEDGNDFIIQMDVTTVNLSAEKVSRTTFLRSDWPRPFARREVGVEMELGRSENKRPEQRRS
ncbi:hypothetical protein TNCV_1077731 [Trichonephila clavipes]|uniref:Uncharacterized protein n=1 Tax=Trichonephila clavipes TaxID=2585209 RepID=A0A8X6RQX5_TRICX|nr:hypothetical protein TNCV_1077731 [Trichonephila clavipes]